MQSQLDQSAGFLILGIGYLFSDCNVSMSLQMLGGECGGVVGGGILLQLGRLILRARSSSPAPHKQRPGTSHQVNSFYRSLLARSALNAAWIHLPVTSRFSLEITR